MALEKSKNFAVAIFLLLLFSCSNSTQTGENAAHYKWKEDSTSFAKNFALQYSKNREISRLLIFSGPTREDTVSIFYKGNVQFNTVNYHKLNDSTHFASLASNYVGFIDALNQAAKISFVDETDYISSPRVRKFVESNLIKECGAGEQLNYEMLMEAKPLILAYEIEGSANPIFEKCSKLGLNTLNCTDFKELHPLGRAEWLKVFAWLCNEQEQGKRLYEEIETHYLETAFFCEEIKNKPTVFAGNIFSGVWNVSGGNSFLSKFITDAGGSYVFARDTQFLNKAMSFETVYNRCRNADIWLHPNNYNSYEDLKSEDNRYELFQAFRQKKVFNNNKKINTFGGNAIWEMGVVRPDIVLRDMAICLHPSLIKDQTTIFYQGLE